MSLSIFILEASIFAFAAGLVYGIFGGGSGLFLMPGFYFLLRHFPVAHGQEMQVAIASTAACSVVLGIFPTWMQWKHNNIDFKIVKKVFLGILTGVVAAVLLLNVVPSVVLKHLFGVVVVLVASWFWFYNQEKDKKHWRLAAFPNYVFTTLIGLLWYLLGIAVFTVPYLQKCGVNMRKAVGTGTLLSTMFSAIAAVLLMITGYFRLGFSVHHIGYVNTTLLLFAVVPSTIAAIIGAKVSVKLHRPISKSVRLFDISHRHYNVSLIDKTLSLYGHLHPR